MSIEQVIQENTTAIRELIAELRNPSRMMNIGPKVEAPKVEAPKVEAPKVEAPKVEAPKVEATKVEATKVEATKVEATKGGAIVYENVTLEGTGKVFLDLCKKPGGKAKAASILADYGKDRLSNVPAEKLGEVMGKLVAAIVECDK